VLVDDSELAAGAAVEVSPSEDDSDDDEPDDAGAACTPDDRAAVAEAEPESSDSVEDADDEDADDDVADESEAVAVVASAEASVVSAEVTSLAGMVRVVIVSAEVVGAASAVFRVSSSGEEVNPRISGTATVIATMRPPMRATLGSSPPLRVRRDEGSRCHEPWSEPWSAPPALARRCPAAGTPWARPAGASPPSSESHQRVTVAPAPTDTLGDRRSRALGVQSASSFQNGSWLVGVASGSVWCLVMLCVGGEGGI
jgi:hypothetical protein